MSPFLPFRNVTAVGVWAGGRAAPGVAQGLGPRPIEILPKFRDKLAFLQLFLRDLNGGYDGDCWMKLKTLLSRPSRNSFEHQLARQRLIARSKLKTLVSWLCRNTFEYQLLTQPRWGGWLGTRSLDHLARSMHE